jgi:type I restriction enzyme R subunit
MNAIKIEHDAPGGDEALAFHLTEKEESQLPAVALLCRLGYKYLTRPEALALRGGKTSRVLLEDVLRAQLQKINRIRYKGREHPFTGANIRHAIQALEDVPLAEGLMHASEEIYDLLRLGKSLEQTIEGDTKSFTLRYIDWNNPENNVFHVTTEYTLQRAGSQQTCRPDIVLFVNGIPFVVIECKAPTEDVADAIRDARTYQGAEWVPELFKYVQIVLGVNKNGAKYATAGTEEKFWAVWTSREDVDPAIAALLSEPLPAAEREAVFASFVREQPHYYAVEAGAAGGRAVTEQDRALYSLCRPERLIELASQFVLYEGGVKKIARYQQYYAVRRAMTRILSPGGGDGEEGPRPGGVIWHTQGSGKSLTMALLANAIALAEEIENPRIVLVTDRIDLDKQIRDTFHRCGLEPRRATSGAELRRLIESPRASVITTLVHKFAAMAVQGEVVDESRNIFVLVDESHRTQYGELEKRMRRVFPNACYIGFTGTPLTKAEKNTFRRFGGLIDAYTMEQAVADKAVVSLLYERRHVEQEVNKEVIDRWFERICQGLTDEQKKDLKKKYSQSRMLTKAEQRLHTTAYDVSEHYRANWQRDGFYKAQFVAPDKWSAIRLHRFLEEIGHVSSAVVISPPDEKEGTEKLSVEPPAEGVQRFWRQMMEKYGTEDRYNDAIVEAFKGPKDPEILIVVDKLITGFDVPRNTVLYLARRLTSHTLLQAIARVNRLYEGKDFGYILDYVGVLGELDRALNEYKALEGYDPEDLRGTLTSVRDVVQDLPQRHAALLDIFKTIRNKNDTEAYERHLVDDLIRQEFYETLTDFAKCLHVALSTELLYEVTPPDTIERYKDDLKRFQKLRASVQRRYADVVDMKKLEPQIAKLLDTYVSSDSVEILTSEPVNIFDTAAMDEALAALGTAASQADTIAFATERTITERMDEDPALFRKFSDMLNETIKAFRAAAISDRDYLQRVRELRDQVVARRSGGDVPANLVGNDIAQAYYRIILERLNDSGVEPEDRDLAAEIALMIHKAIRKEIVVDWRHKTDVQNRMRANIDDGFYELAQRGKIELKWDVIDEIAGEATRVAKSRLS